MNYRRYYNPPDLVAKQETRIRRESVVGNRQVRLDLLKANAIMTYRKVLTDVFQITLPEVDSSDT